MTAYKTVLQAETAYLKRGLVGQHKRKLLQRGFVGIMVFIALIAFVWRVVNTIPQQPSLLYWLFTELNLDKTWYFSNSGISDKLLPFTLLFPIGVLIWDLWLMAQTLVMSSNTIARERNAQNWELLLLTGVSIRQLVRAKWWAVVRQQGRSYTLLAVMRIGAVSFLALGFDVYFWFGRSPSFSYGSLGPLEESQRTIVFIIAISIVVLSAGFIALLTMVNLLFTAACGIVGGCLARRTALSLPAGVGVRLIVMGGIALLIAVPGYLFLKPDIEMGNYYPDPVLSTIALIAALVGAAMVDNGATAAVLLIRFGYNVRWWQYLYSIPFFSITLRGHGPAFLTALVLSSILLAVLTYLLLRRAETILARQSLR